MADVKPIPDGFTGIMPYLVIDGAAKAIDFYKEAFGAEEISRAPGPDGKKLMHAEIKIGSSIVYLCDDFPEFGGKSRNPSSLGGSPVTIHQYVEDATTTIERAVKAGATLKMPPKEQFWGDIYGSVTDPFGHEWSFATHVKDVSPEEMEKAAQEAFSKSGS